MGKNCCRIGWFFRQVFWCNIKAYKEEKAHKSTWWLKNKHWTWNSIIFPTKGNNNNSLKQPPRKENMSLYQNLRCSLLQWSMSACLRKTGGAIPHYGNWIISGRGDCFKQQHHFHRFGARSGSLALNQKLERADSKIFGYPYLRPQIGEVWTTRWCHHIWKGPAKMSEESNKWS